MLNTGPELEFFLMSKLYRRDFLKLRFLYYCNEAIVYRALANTASRMLALTVTFTCMKQTPRQAIKIIKLIERYFLAYPQKVVEQYFM